MNSFPVKVSDPILFKKSRKQHLTNEDNTPSDQQNHISIFHMWRILEDTHSLASRTKYPQPNKEELFMRCHAETVTEFKWARQHIFEHNQVVRRFNDNNGITVHMLRNEHHIDRGNVESRKQSGLGCMVEQRNSTAAWQWEPTWLLILNLLQRRTQGGDTGGSCPPFFTIVDR